MSHGLRQRLIDMALAMNASGLNQGTAGNVSLRSEGGLLITPTGVRYESLSVDDIVFIDAEANAHGPRKPSSEWRFHFDIYRHREDAAAVVHAHPPWCTTLSCLRRPIPAFHYMVAIAGGKDIRCCGYATPGTQELSDLVVQALQGRKACLMANHGMVCLERDADRALSLALEVEQLARVYGQSLPLGEPVLLDDAEMEVMREKFLTYGSSTGRDS